MKQTNLTNLLLDQSKDLVWMINLDFQLIYANKAYLSLMRKITGVEKKLNESVLVEGLGAGDIEQWKTYYNRALKGESFEIEEHYNHPESNEIQYSQVTFEPLTGDDHKIFAIACQSRDGTALVKQRSEANQLIIANKELDFQNQENKNRADELITANKELDFQNEEKKNRADEIIIANKELIIQNEEKKNIADELVIANKELDFQNEEKKNRADEIIIANDKTDIENNRGNQLAIAIKALSDYKYALDQSSIIAITDRKGIINYVNENFCKISKYSADELIGQDHRIISSGYHSKIFIKNLWTTITNGKIWLGEIKNKAKDGTIYWVHTTIVPFLDDKGKPTQYLAIQADITEKKEEEHRLKLLESVITNTNDAILITEAEPFDHPGPRILYVNEAFTKMTGYTSDEVIGKTPRILQGPNSDRKELARLSRAIRNWESCEITTINYKKNREEFWINFKLTPVADEKGCYTHWISIERDVTEQKIKELEINLINEISNIFQQSIDDNLIGCLTNVCEHIAKFGNFEFTEIWLPTNDGQTINRVTNYVSGTFGNAFYKASENLKSLVLGEGMPGFVWKNKKTEIWEDVDVEWGFFKRKIAAKKAGVGAIMGVPLKDNGEVIGVLLVGTEKTKSALALYSRLFQKLESSIGSELSRKKIEIELAQIFDFTPGILCVAGFDGYLKRINPAGLEILGYSLEEMKSRPIRSFVHEEDRLATKEQQTNLYNGGSQTNFENRYITKQGKIVWLSWTAISIPEHGILYAVAKDITEEKNLRELNRQANHLAKIGSWEVDLVKQSVFWSDEVHQLHETDPKSFVPSLEASINFYRADFRKIVQLNVEECISTGESFEFEAVLVTAKKKELWVRIIGTTEFADGVCKRIYGSVQDINSLRSTENRLLSFSENIPGVIYQYIIHPDGTDGIQNVLGNVEELWGYTMDEVNESIKLLWEEIRLGGDIEKVKSSINKAIETKSNWTCRYKIVMPNGELRTHIGNGTPSFFIDGSIILNVIILDITQEVKNEELLEQTTKMARIGSWEMDLINQDGDCMYWSPMIREILEVDDSYNPTLSDGLEFYIEENKEKVHEVVANLINDGLEFDEEILLLTAKGKEQWVRCIGKSEIVNNKRTKIYGSFQDISGQKNMELQLSELNQELQQYTIELERSNEELEQFAFVTSHDLQEPLRMISSFMDLLKRKYGDKLDEKGHQYIHFATDGAKRMKQIILDLLDYSRASKILSTKEEVDFNLVISEFVQLRRKLISEKSASITSGNLPSLISYKASITQVFHCLLDNALQYSRVGIGPIIDINVLENQEDWEFSFKDNGIGIDPQFYNKIFVIFQRLHNREEYAGTGIGLSIAKKQVEFLGGKIWLESELGVGTVFYFTIPKNN